MIELTAISRQDKVINKLFDRAIKVDAIALG